MGIWRSLEDSSEVRILLSLSDQGEMRYSKVGTIFKSRATLDWALRQLLSTGLIKRRIVSETRPAQSYYDLTQKGKETVKHVKELLKNVQ